MDNLGIKRSCLNITSPVTHLEVGDFEVARRIIRQTNDEIAQICRNHSDRFGFFASFPLPDMEGALEEIDYALKLGASGFAVMTNAQGYYVGDPRFDPVFKELNDRKKIIFMHSTQYCSLDVPKADKPLAPNAPCWSSSTQPVQS
jgi:predicted TIM-barrel fold metal-dependent hydrolase